MDQFSMVSVVGKMSLAINLIFCSWA